MEERKKLTQEELSELEQQYYTLTEDLHSYADLFRQPHYREANEKAKVAAKKQYEFYKKALNATIESLIASDWMTLSITVSALKSRFVKFTTKCHIVKYKTFGRHGK